MTLEQIELLRLIDQDDNFISLVNLFWEWKWYEGLLQNRHASNYNVAKTF